MRATIRRLHSPDVQDLSSFQPPVGNDFGFLLQIYAGPSDANGEESFDAVVCTPRWLERQHDLDDVVPGCHHLIVFEYNYDRIVKTLRHLFETPSADTWHELASKLSRYGRWEFADYAENKAR